MVREELVQDIEERISELRQEEKILSERIAGLEELLKQTRECDEDELGRLADRFRGGVNSGTESDGERPIPEGHASEKITEGCLVIEGGAFRGGAYDSGVLDCLMVNDINFQCVLGVSAGAITGLDYMSGQIGRSARLNIGFRHDPRYVGYKALYSDKSLVGFTFLYDTYNLKEKYSFKIGQVPASTFYDTISWDELPLVNNKNVTCNIDSFCNFVWEEKKKK